MHEYVSRVARGAGRRVSNIYFNNTDVISGSLVIAGTSLLFGTSDAQTFIGALMVAAGYRSYRLQGQRYN